MFKLTVLSAVLAGFTLAPAPVTKKTDMPVADAKKRPTTKEEFAALAKELPIPPWIPGPGPQNRVLDRRVFGTVIAVSAESIEVLPKGEKKTVKFPPHAHLATGAICHYEWDSTCYLLDDVQEGDEVMVGYGVVDKEKGPECFYVSIRQRPGDVVPPSRKPSKTNPYHLSRQRTLDYEARGEYTPEELKAHAEKQKLAAEKGLPPPPPLPPLKPTADPMKKKD